MLFKAGGRKSPRIKWRKNTYIYENERTILAVSLELSETTVVAIWNIPLEVTDEPVFRVFSQYGSVKDFLSGYSSTPNVYSGKRLIPFFELKEPIPQ